MKYKLSRMELPCLDICAPGKKKECTKERQLTLLGKAEDICEENKNFTHIEGGNEI